MFPMRKKKILAFLLLKSIFSGAVDLFVSLIYPLLSTGSIQEDPSQHD